MTDDRPDDNKFPRATPLGFLTALPNTVRAGLAAHAVVTAQQAADVLVRLDEDPESRASIGISAEELAEARRILSKMLPVMASRLSCYAEIPLGVPVALEPERSETDADALPNPKPDPQHGQEGRE